MIVELSSGYVGTSAQPAAFRNAAALAPKGGLGAPAPTQAFIRDNQGLAPGGRLAGALASVGGAARGVSEAEALLATADLVDTAIEAADGLANVLRAASGRAAAAGEVNAAIGAGMGTARDDLLEIRGIADQARQTAIKVTTDAGVGLIPRDPVAAGDSLLSSLPDVPSADGDATSAKGEDTGDIRKSGESAPAPAHEKIDLRV